MLDLLFCEADIAGFHEDGNVSRAGIYKQGDVLLVLADFRDGPLVSFKDTGHDGNLVADLESELFHACFHVELCHFLIGEGNGARPGADKSRDTGDVTHHMPGLVRHRHFHENVSREEFDLDILFLSLIIGDRLNHSRDLDIIDKVLKVTVLDDFFEIRLYFVFKTRISVNDIPLGTLVQFIKITHGLAHQSGDAFDDLAEYRVYHRDGNTEYDNRTNDEQRVFLTSFQLIHETFSVR